MLFTQPEFVPNRAHQEEFVRLNPTIANLAAISCLRTTDSFLPLLGDGPADLAKRLALLFPRNAERPDRAAFLDSDPALETEWYAAYASGYASTLIDPTGWNNLREHFALDDPRPDLRHRPVSYFASTYAGDGRDRTARALVNRAFQTADAGLVVRNRPDPKKIAVVSAFYARALGLSDHSGLRRGAGRIPPHAREAGRPARPRRHRFDRSEARSFRQAIDHLIAHPDPPGRDPVRIPPPATRAGPRLAGTPRRRSTMVKMTGRSHRRPATCPPGGWRSVSRSSNQSCRETRPVPRRRQTKPVPTRRQTKPAPPRRETKPGRGLSISVLLCSHKIEP